MRTIIVVFLFVFSTMSIAAQEKHRHHGKEGKVQLTPEIRQLLRQEMQEIRAGMETLPFAVASADWPLIESTARKIQQGYIMSEKLDPAQKQALHETLPHRFRQLDKKFHYYAGMLAHVAKEHDAELANFFVYKMIESCTACHSVYARDRFSGFEQRNRHETRH